MLAALGAAGWLAGPSSAAAAQAGGPGLQFPADHGAHPDSAIEWWYVTGYLKSPKEASPRYGFQLTFFRTRIEATQAMQSAFAAKQLVMAHAALSDLTQRRLMHAQRIARVSGQGQVDLAGFSTIDAEVHLQDWSLRRNGQHYQARFQTPEMALELQLRASQAVLLQGDKGFSRKSRLPQYASHYYSVPQLQVLAGLRLGENRQALEGRAWLDHEWSNSLLAPEAVGWDWVGINLDDGSALSAFRLRARSGQAVWAGGSLRDAAGRLSVFGPDEVAFTPGRSWSSPRNGASYPVQWTLDLSADAVPAGLRRLQIVALLDDQELDSRRSTGTVYWEGLSALNNAQGQTLGYGYLEMTGYAAPMQLP